MQTTFPTVPQVEQLPLYHRETISEKHLDVMGHLNIRWYMALFDEGAWHFFSTFGMDQDYYENQQGGGFALQQFVRYLAEVRVGETITIRIRMLARSSKRIQFMSFMVNETTGKLAATLESLGAHADMTIRRTAPYPDHIATKIDAIIDNQNQLGWDAPVCGVIKP
ncbi:MAG: thioesterase family protein [Chloroflexota bacterium]